MSNLIENHIGGGISVESFRDYFKALLNPTVTSAEIYYASNLISDELLDKPFSVCELKTQLAKTKPNKAPGEDRITYEFFTNASNSFLEILADIYTKILYGTESYEAFQKSIIFPIYKKGDVNLPCNYRGISFTNCISKIMMGMICQRITEWVNRNQILHEYQAGFRKGYSTVDNVYNLTSIVQIKFAEKKKVYGFFVDFKAAFDRVPRRLLIYKLHQIGLSTKIVNFIEKVYQNTESAVWTGSEISSGFGTCTGVK